MQQNYDLISRKAAIEAIEKHLPGFYLDAARDAIAAIPAAQRSEELQKDHNRLVDVICERNPEICEFEERIKLLDELARLDPPGAKE